MRKLGKNGRDLSLHRTEIIATLDFLCTGI
jgi:hypothetical protein